MIKGSNRELLSTPFLKSILRNLPPILPSILFVGATAGFIGLAYLKILTCLEKYLSLSAHDPYFHVLFMAGVGLGVGLLIHYLGHPGDVELMVDNIHLLGGQPGFKNLRSLIPVSLLCIASGGAAGPEAPLVQTSGSFGSWVAQKNKLSKSDYRILTITGMAAGFTVLFGTPLGSALFALEILHRRGLEYHEALLPAIIGSICGYVLCALAAGLHLVPVWEFPLSAALSKRDLVWSFGIGIIAAVLAAIFTYANVALRRIFHFFPAILRPFIGGVILGLLGLWSLYALTFGEAQIEPVLAAQWTIGGLAVIAIAKFVGTSVTISSGWRGGFIIPLFFIGMVTGRILHLAIPSTNEIVLITGLMAALNTGVTKTPLGSTIVVTEMAGLHILPTTLIACIVSLLLTSQMGLIESQRNRDDLAAN